MTGRTRVAGLLERSAISSLHFTRAGVPRLSHIGLRQEADSCLIFETREKPVLFFQSQVADGAFPVVNIVSHSPST